MKQIYIFLLTLLLLNSASAQNTIYLDQTYSDKLERIVIDLVDSTNIYINDAESQELFYYALVPQDSIKGTLILFPPTWQTTESVINHNIELIQNAYSKNLLLIVPSINYNLYLDDESMSFINQSILDVLKRHDPPSDKFVLGGFSLGGMNAIRYSEMAYDDNSKTAIKPIAVYGVDPPLDLARLYYSFQRTIEKNFSQPAMAEARDYLGKLNQQFGGAPEKFTDVYTDHSMYSKSEKDGGNAKYLTSIPVRIYCDPDIDWQLKNRRIDYYDMNAVDQTAMINQLLLMGNDRAEFINSLGKGYRLDGRRHPHSWSLVDPEECVEWILECMANE